MSEREQFEAWMRDCEGYPYAGHYANLMWKAWQASRRAALEEAAKAIEPRNPPDDWTGYARIRAEAAASIRALAANGADSARDAERYRWLRRRAVMMDYSNETVTIITLFKDEGPTGEFLDDQIDGQIAASAAKGDKA